MLDIARSAGGGLATLADGADRHRLFSAFVDSCRGTDTPTVAVIEDLQWADTATLDFIAYTGRRLELARCLLVATHRPDAAVPGSQRSWLTWRRSPRFGVSGSSR